MQVTLKPYTDAIHKAYTDNECMLYMYVGTYQNINLAMYMTVMTPFIISNTIRIKLRYGLILYMYASIIRAFSDRDNALRLPRSRK